MLRTSCTLLAATAFASLALFSDPMSAMAKGGSDGHSRGGPHSNGGHYSGSHDRNHSFDYSCHSHISDPDSYCQDDRSYCHYNPSCHEFCRDYCHRDCGSYCEPRCY